MCVSPRAGRRVSGQGNVSPTFVGLFGPVVSIEWVHGLNRSLLSLNLKCRSGEEC